MTTTDFISPQQQQKIITIKRVFNLPLDSLWKAWREPESCKKWWGPQEYTCPSCSIDFKVGGKYLASMKSADGKEIWSTGTYKEIIPKSKIVYTDSFADSKGNKVDASYYNMPAMQAELMVTVQFEDLGGKTNMTLEHVGLPEEIANDCIKGWQSSFDKLESNIK